LQQNGKKKAEAESKSCHAKNIFFGKAIQQKPVPHYFLFFLPDLEQQMKTSNYDGCKWQAEVPRDRQRGQHPKVEMPENMENTASHVFDPRRVGEACRAALRNGCGPDIGVAAAEIQPEDFNDPDDMYWNGQLGSERKRGTGAKTKEGSAEPWWRTQISQQMDHARLESTERHRRQRIASVLAENEQHRRVAEQAACEMEDEQERVRRREFAKIVLDEEQHTRVREKHLAEDRDLADRNRRRRWAVKALREQEARITMERLHLREIEQGRADPRAPLSRTLVEAAVNRQSTMKRNRALLLAGLELHVHYIRVIEERGKREQSISRRSKVDQMIVDMYTRDCLDVKAAQKESRAASLVAKPCFGSVPLHPTSFEENLLQLRERALKQDFTTAVNARAGAAPSVRALSSVTSFPSLPSHSRFRMFSTLYSSQASVLTLENIFCCSTQSSRRPGGKLVYIYCKIA
jgi:hypothetical protein